LIKSHLLISLQEEEKLKKKLAWTEHERTEREEERFIKERNSLDVLLIFR
jgi:hypothetical protein